MSSGHDTNRLFVPWSNSISSSSSSCDERVEQQDSNTRSSSCSNTAERREQEQQRRIDCRKCSRPSRVCICAALPAAPIQLFHCHCLILQHPHELRHKNRSLPFVELCLAKQSFTKVKCRRFFSTFQQISNSISSNNNTKTHNEEEENVISAMRMLNDSTNPVWLIYPHPDAISLDEALQELQQRQNNTSTTSTTTTCSQQQQGDVKVTLVFLDATWKYAKEMDNANQDYYPFCHDNFKRVQLGNPATATTTTTSSGKNDNDDNNLNNEELLLFPNEKMKRFNIRTPPSSQHLSTAECLAYIVSMIEQEPEIYNIIMKPLDLVVQQWHSFRLEKQQQQQ